MWCVNNKVWYTEEEYNVLKDTLIHIKEICEENSIVNVEKVSLISEEISEVLKDVDK